MVPGDRVTVAYTDNAGELGRVVINYPDYSGALAAPPDTAWYTSDGLGRREQEITPQVNNEVAYKDPFGLCKGIKDAHGKETTAPCKLFAVVMGEARGASRAFQVAVTNVIKNRAQLVRGNYNSVIDQQGAFSSMNADDPNRPVVDATLNHGTVTAQVRDVVEGVYTGAIGDNTQGGLLHYSPRSEQPAGSVPRWNFNTLRGTLDLGTEGKFYKCTQGTSCWERP